MKKLLIMLCAILMLINCAVPAFAISDACCEPAAADPGDIVIVSGFADDMGNPCPEISEEDFAAQGWALAASWTGSSKKYIDNFGIDPDTHDVYIVISDSFVPNTDKYLTGTMTLKSVFTGVKYTVTFTKSNHALIIHGSNEASSSSSGGIAPSGSKDNDETQTTHSNPLVSYIGRLWDQYISPHFPGLSPLHIAVAAAIIVLLIILLIITGHSKKNRRYSK